jgi:cyclopropane fatty-acyl-phospholipid synthase-like methyltransferase
MVDRSVFQVAYSAEPPPWDIGGPQPAFVRVADRIMGRLLDPGCGTGENALFFAARGLEVTGFDFLPGPVESAKQKARERGIAATFVVKDALALADEAARFDSVVDSGLFHVFGDDDRKRYVEGLARVLEPGGRLFLLCFSDEQPGVQGPRRVALAELEAAFARGWTIESIEKATFEVRPEHRESRFSGFDPKAWFMVAERVRSG